MVFVLYVLFISPSYLLLFLPFEEAAHKYEQRNHYDHPGGLDDRINGNLTNIYSVCG